MGDENCAPRRSIPCLHERSPTLPAHKKRSIAFAVSGPIVRGDIPRLCDALRRLLEHGRDIDEVVFELKALVDPDAATVDALARLQLTAQRVGCSTRLRHASPRLRELVSFMGLREPLGCGGASRT
jgi:ABC-type transporter Mla MlaB component